MLPALKLPQYQPIAIKTREASSIGGKSITIALKKLTPLQPRSRDVSPLTICDRIMKASARQAGIAPANKFLPKKRGVTHSEIRTQLTTNEISNTEEAALRFFKNAKCTSNKCAFLRNSRPQRHRMFASWYCLL